MLGELSDALKFGNETWTAGMLLVSTTALLKPPVEMPFSESSFDRISVPTQLDSSVFKYKSAGTLRPLRRGDHEGVCALCGSCWTTCSCEIWVDGRRLP
jgi:hypothetical protein